MENIKTTQQIMDQIDARFNKFKKDNELFAYRILAKINECKTQDELNVLIIEFNDYFTTRLNTTKFE